MMTLRVLEARGSIAEKCT